MNDILAWITGLIAVVVPGFGVTQPPAWNGYVEADYVYVGALTAGSIQSISAHEGDTVAMGDTLFTLDNSQQEALLTAARAQVAAAQANVDNLATGSRQAEIDVVRANLDKAQADLSLAQTQLDRTERLLSQGLVSQSAADQSQATYKSAEAQVAQLDAQLRVAELPARDPQRVAAEATLAAAEANADKADIDMTNRTIAAPVDARVERIYFSSGEIVGAGAPVLSLLPAGALKVKFYVQEADRPVFALGQSVTVSCDGCADQTATVSYFAAQPQFTPPVIYSRDERGRMTFLVEATLGEKAALPPGQPVTITR